MNLHRPLVVAMNVDFGEGNVPSVYHTDLDDDRNDDRDTEAVVRRSVD